MEMRLMVLSFLSETHTIDIFSRLSEMSDSELLRIGVITKFKCSSQSGLSDERRHEFAAQFEAVRNEWKWRFPDLPLSSTFDD
jgi:hypothetical protein